MLIIKTQITTQERLQGHVPRGERLENNYIIDYSIVAFKYKEKPLEIVWLRHLLYTRVSLSLKDRVIFTFTYMHAQSYSNSGYSDGRMMSAES